jgi:hypothetical protein
VEGLDGSATSNYHYSQSGNNETNNSGTIAGNWGEGWHIGSSGVAS